MQAFFKSYTLYFRNKKYIFSLISGFVLLFVSLIINFYAGIYATEHVSNYVNDIILNTIPVYDVDLIFIYGPVVLWAIVIFLCLKRPQRGPYVLKSIALFVIIRSIFISLTHIGPFPDSLIINYTSVFVKRFTFGGDLFFSAHTGLPFLMALVFWKEPKQRIAFIATALIFGIVVLMGHLHYSIDVLSAFFITYSISHIAELFFKKDKTLFETGVIS